MNYCHRCGRPGNAVQLAHTADGVLCQFCRHRSTHIPKRRTSNG